jgi:acetyl coenzyme A synthetase (ADP forming)-like protein
MFTPFFEPAAVAVIGASRTPGKVGHDIVRNLLDAGYAGRVLPVNPKADDVLGLTCYPSVAEAPGSIDLAVLAVPAPHVPGVIDECGAKGIPAVIVISAGFKEAGPEGARLEQELAAKCRRHGIRCIGPNCLGIINPHERMNASFSPAMPPPGNIAFFSQSGALGTAVLDITVSEAIGLSRFISYGNKADVDETDLLRALAQDPRTKVILGYLESIDEGRRFMDAASEVTRLKPVVVFKSGRTNAGARAASSHTGSLAGSDATYDAAFRQCGVIRANTVAELFDYARAFAAHGPPRGNHIAIVTNAGGPGIIATDAIESSGLQMAVLSDETRARLAAGLPPQASSRNPVDVLGDARSDRYRLALDAVCADDGVDCILVLLTPQTSTEPELTADAIAAAAAATDKPVLATFMGSASVQEGCELLEKKGLATFGQPDRAVAALDAMHRYGRWLQTPRQDPPHHDLDEEAITDVLASARERSRAVLGEREARRIVEACGIALPRSILAADEDAAVRAAREVGYPVVLKVSSDDILHKSDADGVRLGLADDEQVRVAFREVMAGAHGCCPEARLDGALVQQQAREGREVIVGMNRDPQFGPVVMFGLGGVHVEVLKDVVFRVAPLTADDARQMIDDIRSAPILRAFRGEPAADTEALAPCLTRVAQLAVRFPEIAECDLNPLLVYPEGQGVMAVDARFGLAPPQRR